MSRNGEEEMSWFRAMVTLKGRRETATRVLQEIWEREHPIEQATAIQHEMIVHHMHHHVIHHVASQPDDATAPAPQLQNSLPGSTRKAISAEPWDGTNWPGS